MPWHLPEDLKRFKRMTVGHPVVMGRRTFQSIGRPLPGRHNIVLSRDPAFRAQGVTVVRNLAEALAAGGLDPHGRAETLFVIGGAEIYRLALPLASRIELTRVEAEPEGDAVFPPIDLAEWRLMAAEPRPGFRFETYVRALPAAEAAS